MKRVIDYQSSESIDDFLIRINDVVRIGESRIISDLEISKVPIFLVLGPPRSGTTLLTQWLSQIGFACPTNLAARFYTNPYFAGLLQRLFTDSTVQYRDELHCAQSELYKSDYGKTSGCLQIHEFSYYYRQYFPIHVGEHLKELDCKNSDPTGFVDGLNAFGNGVNKPVALKGLTIQYNLDLLAKFDNVFLIHCFREEVSNICSLYAHRSKVAGDSDEWISVRPPGYEELVKLDSITQVAGQVSFTNKAIAKQLSQFPEERIIRLSHESFCQNPASYYSQLNSRFIDRGWSALPPYNGPEKFQQKVYGDSNPEYSTIVEALGSVQSMGDSIVDKTYM